MKVQIEKEGKVVKMLDGEQAEIVMEAMALAMNYLAVETKRRITELRVLIDQTGKYPENNYSEVVYTAMESIERMEREKLIPTGEHVNTHQVKVYFMAGVIIGKIRISG